MQNFVFSDLYSDASFWVQWLFWFLCCLGVLSFFITIKADVIIWEQLHILVPLFFFFFFVFELLVFKFTLIFLFAFFF